MHRINDKLSDKIKVNKSSYYKIRINKELKKKKS